MLLCLLLWINSCTVEAQQESWTYQIGTSVTEHVNAVETLGDVIVVAGFTHGSLDGNSNAGSFDIFVMKLDSLGSKTWTFQTGSTAGDTARGVHIESSTGDIIVVGSTLGDLNVLNAGSYDLFVMKLDPVGVHQWTMQTGTETDDDLYAVQIDSSGNIIAGGFTWGSFPPHTNNGASRDILVLQLDTSGSTQWKFQTGSTSNEILWDLKVDASDDIVLAGWTEGQLDSVANAGQSDIYVMKLSNAGATQWTFQTGSSGNDQGGHLGIDSSGNILVGGWTDGDLGNTNKGGTDIFVMQLNSAGTQQWIFQTGTEGSEYLKGFAIGTFNLILGGSTTSAWQGCCNRGGEDLFIMELDSDGSSVQKVFETGSSADETLQGGLVLDADEAVILAGYTNGGLGGNSNAGEADGYVMKVQQLSWTFQTGTSAADGVNALQIDSGNIFLTGQTSGTLEGSSGNVGTSDLFVMKLDSTGSRQWTYQTGSTGQDSAEAIHLASGSIFVAGWTDGDFSGASAGSFDILLIKLDDMGSQQWTYQTGTASADYAFAVETDASGNIFMAGSTDGSLQGSNAGESDIFLMQLDSAGSHQWTVQIGSNLQDVATALRIDASGDLVLAGYTTGDLGNTNAGSKDIFAMKLSNAGSQLWTFQRGSSADDSATALEIDSYGDLVLAGWTAGSLDGHSNAGSVDLFAMKVDGEGSWEWTLQTGTAREEWAGGLQIIPSGRILLAGSIKGGLDGSEDILAVELDTTGSLQWKFVAGTNARDVANAVQLDASNNVILAGTTGGSLNGAHGSEDIFVMKVLRVLDPAPASTSGQVSWTFQTGTSADDSLSRAVPDSCGNVILAGHTQGSLSGSNAGNWDVFAMKLSEDGSQLWTYQTGSIYDDYVWGLAVDSFNSIVLTGVTWGVLGGQTWNGGGDIFVMKLDRFNTLQWTYVTGQSNNQAGIGVQVDLWGSIFVCGWTDGDLHGQVSAGDVDAFVMKLSSAGVNQWTVLAGGSAGDYVNNLAMDASGNIVVVGETYGSFQGGVYAGGKDLFVWKLNHAGSDQWSFQAGTSGNEGIMGVGIDSAGNIFVTGSTNGALGGSSAGSEDVVVLMLDSSGVQQWILQTGTSTSETGMAAVWDPAGSIFVMATAYSSLAGGLAIGDKDVVLLKLDATGNQEWVSQLGTSSTEECQRQLSLGTANNILVAGSTTGVMNGSNAGGQDIFAMMVLTPTTTTSSTLTVSSSTTATLSSTSRSETETSTTSESSTSSTSSTTTSRTASTSSSSTSSSSSSTSSTSFTTMSRTTSTSTSISTTFTTTSRTTSTSTSSSSTFTTTSRTTSTSTSSSSTSNTSSTTMSRTTSTSTSSSSTSSTSFTTTSCTTSTSTSISTTFTTTSRTTSTSTSSSSTFTTTSRTTSASTSSTSTGTSSTSSLATSASQTSATSTLSTATSSGTTSRDTTSTATLSGVSTSMSETTSWWSTSTKTSTVTSSSNPASEEAGSFANTLTQLEQSTGALLRQLSNGTGNQDIRVVSETSIGKVSVMRGGNELNSSVGEYAGLVDETSGAVVPLQALQEDEVLVATSFSENQTAIILQTTKTSGLLKPATGVVDLSIYNLESLTAKKVLSTSPIYVKLGPVTEPFDATRLTCAYLDGDTWSTDGVHLATAEELEAFNLSLSGAWCVSYHLSIFAGFLDLLLDCTNINVLSEENLQEILKPRWWSRPPALFLWPSMALLLALIVLGIFRDASVRRSGLWKDEYFLTEVPPARGSGSSCSRCSGFSCTAGRSDASEAPKKPSTSTVPVLHHEKSVASLASLGQFHQDLERIQKKLDKVMKPAIFSRIQDDSIWRNTLRSVALQHKLHLESLEMHIWGRNGWVQGSLAVEKSPVLKSLVMRLEGDLPEAFVLMHSSRLHRVWSTFLAAHPAYTLLHCDLHVTTAKRGKIFMDCILGSLAFVAIFFSVDGSAVAARSPADCPVQQATFLWYTMVTLFSILLNFIPRSFMFLLAWRDFEHRDAAHHPRQLRKRLWWDIQFWAVAIGLSCLHVLVITAFLANLGEADEWKWMLSFTVVFLRKLIIVPLVSCICSGLVSEATAYAQPALLSDPPRKFGLDLSLCSSSTSKIGSTGSTRSTGSTESLGAISESEPGVSTTWENKVKELAQRGITVRQLLDFYADLEQQMAHFDPDESTTHDVVRQVVIPGSLQMRGSRNYEILVQCHQCHQCHLEPLSKGEPEPLEQTEAVGAICSVRAVNGSCMKPWKGGDSVRPKQPSWEAVFVLQDINQEAIRISLELETVFEEVLPNSSFQSGFEGDIQLGATSLHVRIRVEDFQDAEAVATTVSRVSHASSHGSQSVAGAFHKEMNESSSVQILPKKPFEIASRAYFKLPLPPSGDPAIGDVGCGYAYATAVNRGVPMLAYKMVTHNWGNKFTHLIGAIFADALQEETYDAVVTLLKNKDFDRLHQQLDERNQLSVPYWVCAFSVNQHAGICARAPTADSTGHPITTCSCKTQKHFEGDFSEMNKFDDMMNYLKRRLREVYSEVRLEQVVAMDVNFTLLTRVWCVAELVEADHLHISQAVKIHSGASRDVCLGRLASSDVRRAEASFPADKELVLGKIEDVEVFNKRLQDLMLHRLDSFLGKNSATASTLCDEILGAALTVAM